jgi:AbrB family looped-hinge helix DNA binding protein
MSSKGQVVIPEDIGKRLRLKPGSKLVVVGERMEQFDELIAEARRQAKQTGMKKSDVAAALVKLPGHE